MVALIGQFMTIFCGALLTLVIFGLVLLVSNFPAISRWLGELWWRIARLSHLLYQPVIYALYPFAKNVLRINIWSNPGRTLVCMLLSAIALLLIAAFTSLPLNAWTVGIALVHGLYVGISWDRFLEPEGIRLGEEIK